MYIHNKSSLYDWGETKNKTNLTKHGVGFSAIEEFKWDTTAIWSDERGDYGEDRRFAVGFISERLHIVVYTHPPAKNTHHQSAQSKCEGKTAL